MEEDKNQINVRVVRSDIKVVDRTVTKEHRRKVRNWAVAFILLTIIGLYLTGRIIKSKRIPNFFAFLIGVPTFFGTYNTFFPLGHPMGEPMPPLLERALIKTN